MLSRSGFCAWITCEGKEIIEYESTLDSTGKRVICWIPSEAGKTFSVHWADQGTNVDSATYIKLDGFTVPGRFLFGKGQAQRSGVRVGDDSERPFQFSRVDEAGYRNNPEVGTIAVKIKLVLRNGRRQPNAPQTIPPPARGTHTDLHSFAEECKTYMQTPDTWSFEPYDKSGPSTHVAFVFRYRSRRK
ncbi:uncharacterized protein LAESUDRAFT_646868 [Laetiporus sulphureus 93-53]|uniref:Uncharacterized protein n=1 Tax=Laetiporus sulphureus 93-53 TaxID=1314785 RepID=A0A165FX71_9APHY|nr:uncharacterized protein LAESUDRAFT_646868 [Laetiporus sulphureus 93-53]KZT09531.1 hypothetical protein LAESUDRAFT_646868 [Laetiporus sulphureus 93-53]